jgi:hypothetical protein
MRPAVTVVFEPGSLVRIRCGRTELRVDFLDPTFPRDILADPRVKAALPEAVAALAGARAVTSDVLMRELRALGVPLDPPG